MLNPGTGTHDARYFAMAVVMANHMDSKTERAAYLRRSMTLLIWAVAEEASRRPRSRDVDVRAATRVRAW
jgi:hypothetical protein